MGWAMFSKSLIQFSVDGWGCVLSLLFTWGQTLVEVMKIMVTSFKRSHVGTAILRAPDPVAGHCQPTPLLETPGHLQASLGVSLVESLLLSPGSWCTQGSVCVLQEALSLVVDKKPEYTLKLHLLRGKSNGHHIFNKHLRQYIFSF